MRWLGDLFFHLLVIPLGEGGQKGNGAGGHASALLKEDGDALLLETGSYTLLE